MWRRRLFWKLTLAYSAVIVVYDGVGNYLGCRSGASCAASWIS
jgi:hypothetical protein